ncbi:hypothetical protein CMPELA_04155 [Cupriavidus necator]
MTEKFVFREMGFTRGRTFDLADNCVVPPQRFPISSHVRPFLMWSSSLINIRWNRCMGRIDGSG